MHATAACERKCMKHVHRISAASRRPSELHISPMGAVTVIGWCSCGRCLSAAAARRSESGCDVVAVLLRRGGLQIEDAMATRMGMRTAVARLVQLRCGRIDARKRGEEPFDLQKLACLRQSRLFGDGTRGTLRPVDLEGESLGGESFKSNRSPTAVSE